MSKNNGVVKVIRGGYDLRVLGLGYWLGSSLSVAIFRFGQIWGCKGIVAQVLNGFPLDLWGISEVEVVYEGREPRAPTHNTNKSNSAYRTMFR